LLSVILRKQPKSLKDVIVRRRVTLTLVRCDGNIACTYNMFADELIYWASTEKPAVKMSSLQGTDKVTLLNESKADYTGITLYNNSLYISDSSRRSVFYTVQLGFSHNYNITYMTLISDLNYNLDTTVIN